MDIEAIKKDLIDLCAYHRITICADEDEPYISVFPVELKDAEIDAQHFGFTFVNGEKIIQW